LADAVGFATEVKSPQGSAEEPVVVPVTGPVEMVEPVEPPPVDPPAPPVEITLPVVPGVPSPAAHICIVIPSREGSAKVTEPVQLLPCLQKFKNSTPTVAIEYVRFKRSVLNVLTTIAEPVMLITN
jgi:hypothetical protein